MKIPSSSGRKREPFAPAKERAASNAKSLTALKSSFAENYFPLKSSPKHDAFPLNEFDLNENLLNHGPVEKYFFILFILLALLINGRAQAIENQSCTSEKLSENALTLKMSNLQKSFNDQNLNTAAKKELVKKALDEMNCQVDLSANDKNIDSPSRWKSIQYKDLLNQALQLDCISDKQSLAKVPKNNNEEFLNAYCAKKP